MHNCACKTLQCQWQFAVASRAEICWSVTPRTSPTSGTVQLYVCLPCLQHFPVFQSPRSQSLLTPIQVTLPGKLAAWITQAESVITQIRQMASVADSQQTHHNHLHYHSVQLYPKGAIWPKLCWKRRWTPSNQPSSFFAAANENKRSSRSNDAEARDNERHSRTSPYSEQFYRVSLMSLSSPIWRKSSPHRSTPVPIGSLRNFLKLATCTSSRKFNWHLVLGLLVI